MDMIRVGGDCNTMIWGIKSPPILRRSAIVAVTMSKMTITFIFSPSQNQKLFGQYKRR